MRPAARTGYESESGAAPPVADVCICSYRRPEIAQALQALSRQTGLQGRRFRVVVADNTPEGAMRDVVMTAAAACHLDLDYIHAPANNISIARNACIDNARAPWIAFLDDDEVPSAHWLATLLREAGSGNWDAILGPVSAVYGERAPGWMIRGEFHSTRPVWTGGEIRSGYTGNVLFRAALVRAAGLRFRTELGASGGEDEDFFSRFHEAGGRIGFACDATVQERVDPARANMRWLMLRNFRAGQSYGSRLKRHKRISSNVIVASAKALACAVGAAFCAPHALRRNRFLTRAALHCGVVARLSGLSEIRMY